MRQIGYRVGSKADVVQVHVRTPVAVLPLTFGASTEKPAATSPWMTGWKRWPRLALWPAVHHYNAWRRPNASGDG